MSYFQLSTTGPRVKIEKRLDEIQNSQNAGKYLSPRGKFNIESNKRIETRMLLIDLFVK